jgi:hypothetical protein
VGLPGKTAPSRAQPSPTAEDAAGRGRARRGCRARPRPAEPSQAKPSPAVRNGWDGAQNYVFKLPRSLIGRHGFRNCRQNLNWKNLMAILKKSNSP